MEPFLGQVMLFAGNFAPRGWAFCNGQLMSIAQNTALFSILGTTYGGDGITTFGLPDLRGRAAIGFGQGPGLSNYTLGESSGAESTTLTSSNLPVTTNHIRVSSEGGNVNSPENARLSAGKAASFATSANTILSPAAVAGNAGGNSSPIPNGGPRLGLTYIIALEGIYPSRS